MSGLTNGTLYYHSVRSYNGSQYSSWASHVSARPVNTAQTSMPEPTARTAPSSTPEPTATTAPTRTPGPTNKPEPTATPDCPAGASGASSECPARLNIPANLSGTAGEDELSLDWDAVLLADSYEVQQKVVRTLLPDEWKTLPLDDFSITINNMDTSARVTGLSNGETYYHRVRAVSGNIASEWSDEVETELPADIPDIPSGLKALHGPKSQTAMFDWDDANLADKYDVQLKTSGFFSLLTGWKTLPSGDKKVEFDGSSAVVKGLTENDTYRYRVRGVNTTDDLESNWSPDITKRLMSLHHQADNVVRYGAVGSMPTILSNAITTAVRAWNNSLNPSGWTYQLCTFGSESCIRGNTDHKFVTVTKKTGDHRNTLSAFIPGGTHYADCGKAVACVKSTDPYSYDPPLFNPHHEDDSPAHMENVTIIIEDPAYEQSRHGYAVRVYWTDNPAFTTGDNWYTKGLGDSNCQKFKMETGASWTGNCAVYYLPSVVMHEFGHAMGLYHPKGFDEGILQDPQNLHLMAFGQDDTAPKPKDVDAMEYRHDNHPTTDH